MRPDFFGTAIGRLCDEFSGTFSRETIEVVLRESFEQLSHSKVKGFIPLFAERFTKERLKAVGQAEGIIAKDVPEVLFVCVHNAGRSQMAAALLDHEARGEVHVRSAGSTPADEIHGGVREAMAEIGIDISKEFPKPLTDDVIRAADVVVTMGCGDACPVYPGKRYLDWELPDPAGQPVEKVRAIRDQIAEHVRNLLTELVGASAG